MLPLSLVGPGTQPGRLRVLAIGAHPDDIEIGCGGTLLKLAQTSAVAAATYVVTTGDARRAAEASDAARLFLPGVDVDLRLGGLPDGRLPAHWNEVKELLESVAAQGSYDLVLGPHLHDAHQDHRLLAELITTCWRDHLVLGYELPKWDGDIGQPSVYVSLSEQQGRDKVERLHKAFPSQAGRDWWDPETFLGLARLRGMESRSHYAEAFTLRKATLTW